MQSKLYNSYNIVHKNGEVEKVNAESLKQALENMLIPEEESPVARGLLVQSDVRTLIKEVPDEVVFTAVVDEASLAGGNIATPAEGVVHVGDTVQLKAIPNKNYEFVKWERNGELIGIEETLNYVMTPLEEGIDSAIFTATFKLKVVNWKTAVKPETASAGGCIAFPTKGMTEAFAPGEFLAEAGEGYSFSHWERNGVTLSDNRLFQTESIEPLASTEDEAVYTAVFTLN